MQSRTFCFTINNYSSDDENNLKGLRSPMTFICYGKEIAPTTGTPHLQGYIMLEYRMRLRTVKKLLGDKAHIEPTDGDFYQNVKYCSKEGDFWTNIDEITEQYALTKDFQLPDYWTAREIFEFRCCYNPDCDIPLESLIKQHDSYLNFLLTRYPKKSRTKIVFESEPIYDFL